MVVRESIVTVLGLVFLTVFSSNLRAEQSRALEFIETPSFNAELYEQAQAYAEELGLHDKSDFDRYFSVETVEVTPLDQDQVARTEGPWRDAGYAKSGGLGEIVMIVDQLIALGRQIWPIIEAGRPVVNTNFAPAISVLPRTDESPDNVAMYLMDSWAAPRQQSYLVEYKNGFGSAVISFTYTVSYQYNGQYEGKGRYLTGLDVAASQIRVSWGFSFDANSSLVNISNRGTRDEPIASATVRISYKAQSFLSNIQSTESFHVTGDGQLQQVY